MPFPNLNGAPVIEFTEKDWQQVEQMCAIHCRKEEICAIIGVSEDTLERRIKEKYGIRYAEYFEQKSSGGKMSLRRRQYTQAMDGNTTMLIWLGKQWLGQSDEIKHSGSVKFDLAYSLDEDEKAAS